MDIDKILRKRKWSGKEVGKLILTDLAIRHNVSKTGERKKPLLDEELLKDILSKLPEEEGTTYNNYVYAYSWIVEAEKHVDERTYYCLYQAERLKELLSTCVLGEDIYTYTEQLPKILTEKEYSELRENSVREKLYNEDGTQKYVSLAELIFDAIYYYLKRICDEETENPLRAIKKVYVSKPVKNSRILSVWNRETYGGYYALSDGRRSDQMSYDEWQEFCSSDAVLKACIFCEPSENIYYTYTTDEAIERLKNYHRITFRKPDKAPLKWVECEEEPNITKWDVIESKLIRKFYKNELEELKYDYPELIEKILSDIARTCSEHVESVTPDVSKWEEPFITEEELYNKDIYGERNDVESDFNLFIKSDMRAIMNGIAILSPSNAVHGLSKIIDAEDRYIEPDLYSARKEMKLTPTKDFGQITVACFLPDNDNYADAIKMYDDARACLIKAVHSLVGYNTQLELIAEALNVPELKDMEQDLSIFINNVKYINKLTRNLMYIIGNTYYRDAELKRRKLSVFFDILTPIKEEYLIPEENKEKAVRLIKTFQAFSSATREFEKLLCVETKTKE